VKLTPATGENSNPLFFLPPVPAQQISPDAKPTTYTAPTEFAYDITTKPGETIGLVAAR
jgi:hypothetical protein